MLITFSGLDGSGKTTLICDLRENLEEHGSGVVAKTMYFHIGPYAAVRSLVQVGRRVLDRLGGSLQDRYPRFRRARASQRVNSTAAGKGLRQLLGLKPLKATILLVDLLHFYCVWAHVSRVKKDILIMDRYFYDSLVDVSTGTLGALGKRFLRLCPVPDLAIYLDVSPEVAFGRKGEYSVQELAKRERLYSEILSCVSTAVRIPNADWDEAKSELLSLISSTRPIGRQNF